MTQDRHFVNFLKSKIPLFEREASFEDQISKWEFIKYKCREACRTYSIQKSKERRARRVELEKKLADLEQLLRTNNTENIGEEYDICQSELDQLYDYITAGIIMHSNQVGMNTVKNLPSTSLILKNVIRLNHTFVV